MYKRVTLKFFCGYVFVVQLIQTDVQSSAFDQEFGKGLLRAALKKATEHSIRKEDERLGAVIGIVNAMTEKADTRNWQTLPHSIFYSRVPLKEGVNTVKFTLQSNNQRNIDYNFTYPVKQRAR